MKTKLLKTNEYLKDYQTHDGLVSIFKQRSDFYKCGYEWIVWVNYKVTGEPIHKKFRTLKECKTFLTTLGY